MEPWVAAKKKALSYSGGVTSLANLSTCFYLNFKTSLKKHSLNNYYWLLFRNPLWCLTEFHAGIFLGSPISLCWDIKIYGYPFVFLYKFFPNSQFTRISNMLKKFTSSNLRPVPKHELQWLIYLFCINRFTSLCKNFSFTWVPSIENDAHDIKSFC